MSKKILIYLFVLIFASVSFRAVYRMLDNETKNNTPMTESPESYTILALGDSLAKGTGDEKGKGFSVYLTEELQDYKKKPVNQINQGVNGLTSEELLNILEAEAKTDGNMDTADLIIVSIGGNNLNSLRAQQPEIDPSVFNKTELGFLSDLGNILRLLQVKHPGALIAVTGLYNPFEFITSENTNKLLTSWNSNTELLVNTFKNAVFIPVYDTFKGKLGEYLAEDRFHPNSKGYEEIAKLIFSYTRELLP